MRKNYKILLIIFSMLLLLQSSICFAANFAEATPPDIMRDFEQLRYRIKQNPRDIAALNSLGIIYARYGKLEDAAKLWRYAMQIDPTYVHLYNNLGSALKQSGRKDEARIVFKTGLARSNSYWIHYNLGLLEKEDGNMVAAANCFKMSAQRNPSFQPALKQLQELGYQTRQAAMPMTASPMSLGSYKAPVDSGNIDFYPLLPNQDSDLKDYEKVAPLNQGYARKPAAKKPSIPFQALSAADCHEIVKSHNAPAKDRYLALTFDDGPHHSLTPQLLDILKQEGAKATFFVVGSRAETYPDIISRIAAEGHDVGNHTWEHASLARSSKEKALSSLQRTSDLISGLTARPCVLVRPPFGHTSQKVKALLHGQGWHEILWDSDSRDWENKNPERILQRVMKSAGPRSIVLFHDIHPGAAVMLPTMIRAFKSQGYRFITITELIALASSS